MQKIHSELSTSIQRGDSIVPDASSRFGPSPLRFDAALLFISLHAPLFFRISKC